MVFIFMLRMFSCKNAPLFFFRENVAQFFFPLCICTHHLRSRMPNIIIKKVRECSIYIFLNDFSTGWDTGI